MIPKQSKLLFLFVLFMSNTLFSQIEPINIGVWDEILDGFKYNDVVYKTKSKDLKRFINDIEMSKQLKENLFAQYHVIKVKERISKGFFYGGLGASVYFFIDGSIDSNKYYSQSETYNNVFQKGVVKALSVGVIGTVVHLLVKPKKKHYLNFINSFNKEYHHNVSVNFKLNYTKQFNYGLVVSF